MKHAFAFVAIVLAAGMPSPARAAPNVVATVKPIHSLVAGVMAGIAAPVLLIKGATSPHRYALRPSAARALGRADIVFRVGGGLENFLARPLAVLASKARVATLRSAPGMRLLAGRKAGLWEDAHHRDEVAAGDPAAPDEAMLDPHIWLDPRNARAMVAMIAATLAGADPDNAGRYAANTAALTRRIDDLDAELRTALAPLRGRRYIVLHDAYHYLEARYGLTPAGAITVSPDRPPGARRVREIRRRIVADKAVCVFAEPQFAPAIVRTVSAGTPARTGVLDPLGAALPAGPGAYFALMRGLAAALRRCLLETG
jgi:zinc transport system substrate-binding protein